MAGRIPIVAVGVPAWGLRGGWRDYCIVNAPERSGPVAFVVLLALVSRRAFVVAKRWGVRRATSGSSQRDRLRVEGSLARWLLRGRPNWQGVFDGAKRERVGRPEAVGLCEAYRIARSGGLVQLSRNKPQGPGTPVAKHRGWRGRLRSWPRGPASGGVREREARGWRDRPMGVVSSARCNFSERKISVPRLGGGFPKVVKCFLTEKNASGCIPRNAHA